MGYEITADKTMRELEAGRVARQTVLEMNDKLTARFLGIPKDEVTRSRKNPSMHEYSFITLHLPRLAFRAPRTLVTSAKTSLFGEWAEAIERALNRISRDQDDETLSTMLAMAFFFSHAATLTEPSVHDDRDDRDIWLPTTTFLDQDRFLIDPQCNGQKSAFWQGHLWTMDKDEMVERAEREGAELGWDIKAVKALDTDSMKQHTEINSLQLERNEVAGYQVWFPKVQPDPEVGPEDGANGAMIWLAPGGSEKDAKATAKMLRKPHPYIGPKTGPYQMFGYMPVPKSPYYLSPLAATHADSERLNMVMSATDEAVDDYKKMVGLPQGLKDKKNFPHGSTFEIPGMDPTNYKPTVIELGGPTEQMLAIEAIARDRLERTSSMDSGQQGRVTGKGTATENAIVDSVTQRRSDYQKNRFLKGWTGLQRQRAHYLVLDDRVEVGGLGEDGSEIYQGGNGSGELRDGQAVLAQTDPNEHLELLESLEIDIETMSTEATNEPMHKRNVMLLIQMFVSWLPMIQQFPTAPWQGWMIAAGEANNVPDIAQQFDIDQFLAGAQIPPGTSPQDGGDAELMGMSRDAGKAIRGLPLLGNTMAPSVGAV